METNMKGEEEVETEAETSGTETEGEPDRLGGWTITGMITGWLWGTLREAYHEDGSEMLSHYEDGNGTPTKMIMGWS